MLRNLKDFSLPELEEKVLAFWRANHVFQLVTDARRGGPPFVFFEGPPTANGRPGIHHVLSRSFKDAVNRYQTMRGRNVLRRAGWDTQGLAVEIEAEKKLGLNSKKDIEAYGIARFNDVCRKSVWQYRDDWERLTERMGFWLDMEHPYITYENSYLESLWWVLKEMHERELLYKGHKVVPHCPRCGTALSSHEVAQGYAETKDTSVYIKFKVADRDNTYFVSWTTTPWTLPGNVALAVGENIRYVESERGGERFIYAKDSPFAKEWGTAEKEFFGKELVGMRYEPLFDIPALRSDASYKVYPAGFVATDEGTGIVHTAVMYGIDDYELGAQVGLPQHHTVNPDGTFTDDVPELKGVFVKSAEAEERITEHLQKKGALIKTEPYVHEYPFCWRCDTPLLYYARDSWFIAVSKLRDELLRANEGINWVPEHVKNGRFGEWLLGAKDWALSRERYWGTPLPVWECASCGAHDVVGSLQELSLRAGGVKNRYVVMRHGEAEHNVLNVMNGSPANRDMYALTGSGVDDVREAVRRLREGGVVDVVVSSDFRRARETAGMIASAYGIPVTTDERLREVRFGDFEGRPAAEYHAHFSRFSEKFEKRLPGDGETLRDVARRIASFFSDMERRYEGKRVVVVTHEYPAWIFEAILSGSGEEEAARAKENPPNGEAGGVMYGTAECREIPALSLPRNEYGFADLHRPFIDDVVLRCRCGAPMRRVPEVVDVWFDSGAMPYAEWHYPFENGAKIDEGEAFPADFITEAVDQTRGWFYTLLAVSVALGRGAPYRNVICLGHVLDAHGRKMSKSRGNAVDPWEMARKHGIDAVRWYLYTVNAPGEPKRFDESELQKFSRGVMPLVYNSFLFFETYHPASLKLRGARPTSHILDRWIAARIRQLTKRLIDSFEAYDVGGAARAVGGFVDDLSRWYIRRSRTRFQHPKDDTELLGASSALGEALAALARLLAPFMPFLAEGLHQSLRDVYGNLELSVHLEGMPDSEDIDEKLLSAMAEVRRLAQLALALREKAGIKVRQPLRELRINPSTDGQELKGKEELLQILKDEVNVKTIVFDESIHEEAVLDTEVTHELKEEGVFRELTRCVQELRRDAGCKPKDVIAVAIHDGGEVKRIILAREEEFKAATGAKTLEWGGLTSFDAEKEMTIDGSPVVIRINKL